MLHIQMKCRCAYLLRLPIWMLQRLAPYYRLQYFISLFHCLSQGLHEKLSKMPSYFIYSFHANIIMSYSECYICTQAVLRVSPTTLCLFNFSNCACNLRLCVSQCMMLVNKHAHIIISYPILTTTVSFVKYFVCAFNHVGSELSI